MKKNLIFVMVMFMTACSSYNTYTINGEVDGNNINGMEVYLSSLGTGKIIGLRGVKVVYTKCQHLLNYTMSTRIVDLL